MYDDPERAAMADALHALSDGENYMPIGEGYGSSWYFWENHRYYVLDAGNNCLGWIKEQSTIGGSCTVTVENPCPGLYDEVAGSIAAAMLPAASPIYSPFLPSPAARTRSTT